MNITKGYFRLILNITTKRETIHYNLHIVIIVGDILKSNRGTLSKEYVDNYIVNNIGEIVTDDAEVVTKGNKEVGVNVNISKKKKQYG